MRWPTAEDLHALLEEPAAPSVSIYMPVNQAERQRPNRIRLKSLLGRAESLLLEQGLKRADVHDITAGARRLLQDGPYFDHPAAGLALFLSRRRLVYCHLPEPPHERVVVRDRFHVKPLLPFLDGVNFHILALSQNAVRLFWGTRFGVSEVTLPDIPTSLAEAMRFEVTHRAVQAHTTGPAGGGVSFHSQTELSTVTKDQLLRFFREVDRGVRTVMRHPLLLAGVDYLLAIYREANTYPDLLADAIPGNPEHLRPAVLYEKALPAVLAHFRQGRLDAAARYIRLHGTGLSSDRLDEILPAAEHGRVEVLWVASGETNSDLLDLAAVHAYRTGARLFVVPPGEVPGPEPVAAIFRY